MTKNVKSIFLVATLLFLLVGVSAISASEVSDDTSIQSDIADTVAPEVTTMTTDNKIVDTPTKNIKKEAKTHIVNNNTITSVFSKEGTSPYNDAGFNASLLGDDVEDGDTLDFQGQITGNYNLTINKAVNIISSTNDAMIELNTTSANLLGSNPGNHFIITKEGSYTNITGINFHNTQLFVYNANHVILDNISAVVEDRTIGGGIGQTSIRENSTYITVKNSYFYTRNNGGSSTLVLAWADNCTILNNTIKAEGNSGNLFYITTINLHNYDWMDEGIIINCDNKIINNTIGTLGQATGGIQWAFVLTGTNNTIDGNEILCGGIQSQYGGSTTGNGTTYIINNHVYDGGLSSNLNNNLTIENNLFGSNIMVYYNATIKNNTFNTLNLLQETSTVTNNSFKTLNIQGTSRNNYIADNNISGTVNIQTTNNTFINNNITNNEDYTVKVTGSNNNISNNFLVAGTIGGIETTSISDNNIVENNRPLPTEYTITEDNYSNFFDENGYYINKDIENYDLLILNGTFNNKNFIFNNTIHNINGLNCTINNGQIKITDNGQIVLNNVTINNDNTIDTTIQIDSDKNTISNITINHNTTNNINEIIIQESENQILNNNINIVNTNDNTITKAIYITNNNQTPIIKTNIKRNNINLTTKTESYALDSDVSFNTNNITLNNITINTNGNIHAINLAQEGKSLTITTNTIKLNTTQDAKAIKITEQQNNTISNNDIIITGANVQAIELLSTNNTITNQIGSWIANNNITITSDNTTVMTLMAKCDGNQNNIKITSPETTAIHYINAYNSNMNFQNTISLNIENGTAAIIENSYNTYISGTINTQKAIKYINTNNLTRSNIGPIISNDTYTMIFDSCENIRITNSYLISDNYHKGGDETVNIHEGDNVTITNNIPDFAYLNDETYTSLFDENNIFTSTKSQVFIAPELNNKTMIFNSNVNITSINDAIINGGILKLTENATNSIMNNTRLNNTQIILEANNTKLVYSQIYQNKNLTPLIKINNTQNIYLQYNNILADNTENIDILIDNSASTYIQYNNITGENVEKLEINANNSKSLYIQNNNITSLNQNEPILINVENVSSGSVTNNYLKTNASYGTITINTINSTITISNNKPVYEIVITDNNYNTYFDDESNYIGDSRAEALIIGSDIHNKNFTFNQDIMLNNPDHYVLYNTTIKSTSSSTDTTLYNLTINNTNYNTPAIISNGPLTLAYSNIIQTCNNTEVMIIENSSVIYYIDYNNITCNGDNNTILKVNNNRIGFRYNNVNVSGTNSITLLITNYTSRAISITNNNFTANTNSSTTHFIFDNARVTFSENNVKVNAYQNDNPIIKVITTSNGRVTNNYIVSNDLVGDAAISGPGSNSDNMPYTTTITLINTTALIETPITITATVLLNNIEPMPLGTVTFTDQENNILAQVDITNGIASIELNYPEEGVYEITATYNVTYPGLEIWNSTTTATITIIDNTTKLIINPITATAGDVINISANIIQNHQTLSDINKGKVTFKVNGKTLKDTNGKVIYAKVVNGIATIENYIVPDDWTKEGTTIEAVYSGSTQCDKLTSEKTEITIEKAVPTLTTSDVTAAAGETIALTAQVTDNDKVINNGKIVFKINGKTVKDSNGKVIYAKVVNNQVSVEYTLPADMKAKTYNITATFISSDYERIEDTKTLTVTA